MEIASAPDEMDLLRKLREGDVSAFEQLYGQYKIKLTGNLLRMLKSPELVEDVLQDLFLGLWENRARIDPERSIRPYLFQSAANKAKNIFRRAGYEQKFRDYLLPQWSEYYSHVEELLVLEENKHLLDSLLNQLSPQQRTVYSLCKLEEKSYKEVAAELHISETTVNTHIRNANLLLKKLTQEDPRFLSYFFGFFVMLSLR
ncbi:sigma-70 family RNA polymerase sigma factor [Sphingobacterium alkalisoli]|uniref:Sigma-70 family RNA polymerase sigma factor n=1 Tax=Sphingobacterium alkalisoli TaxID=1874115 RepID=A0A4U0GUM1_9SPHI|nr:sigma-70 family RNA polymerase sigma factor [Sphingobacterium alkalisoli]TJY61412.1 sigma-70 family RNA polymerase sigma factor [Sphingobacterium alkalisoli]GGH30553.1 DNA-directed RNA polymerase sigma-70 factor [Sphingobacterium alkalisoli]